MCPLSRGNSFFHFGRRDDEMIVSEKRQFVHSERPSITLAQTLFLLRNAFGIEIRSRKKYPYFDQSGAGLTLDKKMRSVNVRRGGEMAYTPALGAGARKSVEVQVLSPAVYTRRFERISRAAASAPEFIPPKGGAPAAAAPPEAGRPGAPFQKPPGTGEKYRLELFWPEMRSN